MGNRLNGGRSTRTATIRAVAPISLFPVWVYVRWGGGEGAGGYAETWLGGEAKLPNQLTKSTVTEGVSQSVMDKCKYRGRRGPS